MLSHGNIVANVMQIDGFFETWHRWQGQCVYAAMPVYHVYAFTVSMYSLRKGAHAVHSQYRDLGSM